MTIDPVSNIIIVKIQLISRHSAHSVFCSSILFMGNIIKVDFIRTWYHYLEQLIQHQLREGVFPGIELLFAAHDEIYLHQTWGRLEIGENAPTLPPNTIFDIASMTKPIATATAIMILQERGFLNLNDPVAEFVPEFGTDEKSKVTLRHLLTHTAGLPAWANLYEDVADKREAWQRLISIPLDRLPDQQMVYSCLGFLILGEIVDRLTQQSLAQFSDAHIFKPLRMHSTCFKPLRIIEESTIAPTQFCPFRNKLLRGIVHDENCYIFNEEGGNSGLFSRALEIYRFCQMIFNEGELEGAHVLSPMSVRSMVRNHNPPNVEPRGLGWDLKSEYGGNASCGSLFPPGSIGHTGFTGTSFWLNIPSRTVVIVLTNRVHISRERKVVAMRRFRSRLHNILMASLETMKEQSKPV